MVRLKVKLGLARSDELRRNSSRKPDVSVVSTGRMGTSFHNGHSVRNNSSNFGNNNNGNSGGSGHLDALARRTLAIWRWKRKPGAADVTDSVAHPVPKKTYLQMRRSM